MRKVFILPFVFLSVIVAFSVLELRKDKSEDKNFWDCQNCNVILITLTSTRKDHLSAYGYTKNTTPNISKLAQNAIIFNNAFTQASRTIPAGLSLHTSQYSYTHRIVDQFNSEFQLSSKKDLNPASKTLAEILQENGYKTAAFTGGGHYKGAYGFDKGFETYEDKENFIGLSPNIPKAIDWIKENKNSKFFLFLQSFDAHCPYTPPSPYDRLFDPNYQNKNNLDFSICHWSYRDTKTDNQNGVKKLPLKLKNVTDWGGQIKGKLEDDWKEEAFEENDIKHLISLYDGSLAFADSQIQKVLEAIDRLNLTDQTIVIITSDHGELLGEYGRFMRGGYLSGTYHDAVLNIPLIIKNPKMEEGKKIDGLAQLIDIGPTVLDLLYIPNYQAWQGKSLVPLIKDGKEVHEYVYGGSLQYRRKSQRHYFSGVNEVDFIRNKQWKFIKEKNIDQNTNKTEGKYELYNLQNDPQELNNLADKEPEVFVNLRSKLEQWFQSTQSPNSSTTTMTPAEQEELERLREAGRKRGYW